MTNDANKDEVIAFESAANGTLGESFRRRLELTLLWDGS
jgi:hypothetical protein